MASLFPGTASPLGVTEAEVSLAQAGQRDRFLVAAGEFAQAAEGAFVILGGLLIVAELMAECIAVPALPIEYQAEGNVNASLADPVFE